MALPALEQVIAKLDAMHGEPPPLPSRDPFALVLWENIAYLLDDTKRRVAFDALAGSIGLTPEAIEGASDDALLAVAKLGGMRPEQRIETLRGIADIALELGDLNEVAARPFKEARRALQRFPSLGEPGAEKILMMSGHHAVLALESNGLRVLLRLGFGEEKKSYASSYKSVREALGPLSGDAARLTHAHVQLRRHGQEICRRTVPACDVCVLRPVCKHAR